MGSVDDPPEARAGTSGVPLTGMEATVRDPETGRECAPDEVGEFLHRGVSRMAYYHGDPETTAERIDADGWFHTGDLVRRDAAGRFTFVSRLKDMLKVGGENVAAAEVEGRLAEHPAVGVVAVVAAPDARLGEVAGRVRRAGAAFRGADREVLGASSSTTAWRRSRRTRRRATSSSSTPGPCPARRSRRGRCARGSRPT